ncbi:MAG: hypothetical protein ACFBSC_21095 [Microcoleaceae cyanobacterium]
MEGFEGLDPNRQRLVARYALAIQNIRVAFANYPRVVSSVLGSSAGQANQMNKQSLQKLMKILDDHAISEGVTPFPQLKIQEKIRGNESSENTR